MDVGPILDIRLEGSLPVLTAPTNPPLDQQTAMDVSVSSATTVVSDQPSQDRPQSEAVVAQSETQPQLIEQTAPQLIEPDSAKLNPPLQKLDASPNSQDAQTQQAQSIALTPQQQQQQYLQHYQQLLLQHQQQQLGLHSPVHPAMPINPVTPIYPMLPIHMQGLAPAQLFALAMQQAMLTSPFGLPMAMQTPPKIAVQAIRPKPSTTPSNANSTVPSSLNGPTNSASPTPSSIPSFAGFSPDQSHSTVSSSAIPTIATTPAITSSAAVPTTASSPSSQHVSTASGQNSNRMSSVDTFSSSSRNTIASQGINQQHGHSNSHANGVVSTGSTSDPSSPSSSGSMSEGQTKNNVVITKSSLPLPSPSKSNFNPQPFDTSNKRSRRLIKNREAARECRRKKKEYVKEIEQKLAEVERINKSLLDEVQELRKRLDITKPS